MADTIRYQSDVFQGWISGIESSLNYDTSSVDVSSKETLTAVKMLQESISRYVNILKLLSEDLYEEAGHMRAAGDSMEEADKKARGHFSGKL